MIVEDMKDNMNLDWIDELIKLLPEISPIRKNMIEISGFPRWETVNSNLLAFYFDNNEEHGFNNLFIDSLYDIIEEKTNIQIFKRQIFETDFSVEREWITVNGKRIDILLSENYNEDEFNSNWAIIIENKLNANLYNDLLNYWDSVKSKNKIGIVLTINPLIDIKKNQNDKIYFINITHKELSEKVTRNLPKFYLNSDDRHLLFLKEYLLNINSLYQNEKDQMNMDKILQKFHDKKEEIINLNKMEIELMNYVSKSLYSVMSEFGFKPNTEKTSVETKHFYADNLFFEENDNFSPFIESLSKLRFWLKIGQLRYEKTISGVFELFGRENTIYGTKLIKRLEELNLKTDYVKFGSRGFDGSTYFHLYYFEIPIDNFEKIGFKDQLRNSFNNQFFNHHSNLFLTTIKELDKIIKQ
jgi:hypothetical protein